MITARQGENPLYRADSKGMYVLQGHIHTLIVSIILSARELQHVYLQHLSAGNVDCELQHIWLQYRLRRSSGEGDLMVHTTRSDPLSAGRGSIILVVWCGPIIRVHPVDPIPIIIGSIRQGSEADRDLNKPTSVYDYTDMVKQSAGANLCCSMVLWQRRSIQIARAIACGEAVGAR